MITLSVPTCPAAIARPASRPPLPPCDRVTVDLPARTVRAEGAPAEALVRALAAIGFPHPWRADPPSPCPPLWQMSHM